MWRRLLIFALLVLPTGPIDVGLSSAEACPMCKQANEVDEVAAARPRAYMYSILFMLSMPMMIFSGFGFALYRVVKKSERDLAEQALLESDPSGEDTVT